MLPKVRRVERNVFKSLDRPLKIVKGKVFLLRIFKHQGKSLFAVSVSKKQEKKAVLRNKIRRFSYAAIAENLKNVPDGFIYHFSLNQKPKDLKHDINKDINDCLL